MDALAIAQIDTLKWMDPSSKNEPYVHYYHSHLAYQDFPVFNISYEGAQLYCQWLTDNYNQNTKRKFKKVIFKLPTEQEWIQAAQGGDLTARYPWKGNELYSKEKLAKCNFTRDARDTAWVKGPVLGNKDVMTNVKAYWPNAFGLYNMSGNAAEMIDVKGVTKGGGWRTTSEYTDITSKYTYEGNAEQFVGFRYFMQVLEF
jgi:formylglycine-generating enzyme required for sulfatase activity